MAKTKVHRYAALGDILVNGGWGLQSDTDDPSITLKQLDPERATLCVVSYAARQLLTIFEELRQNNAETRRLRRELSKAQKRIAKLEGLVPHG